MTEIPDDIKKTAQYIADGFFGDNIPRDSVAFWIAKAVSDERRRCARIAQNPGFVEARDTEFDEGVNYARIFISKAIRQGKAALEDTER